MMCVEAISLLKVLVGWSKMFDMVAVLGKPRPLIKRDNSNHLVCTNASKTPRNLALPCSYTDACADSLTHVWHPNQPGKFFCVLVEPKTTHYFHHINELL